MRDESTWNEKVLPKRIEQLFTPRLIEDLTKIPYRIKDIPPIGSYLIQGPVGSGKTLLAAHITLEAAKQQFLKAETGEIIFVTVPEFLNHIKMCFEDPAHDEQFVLDRFSKAYFLTLDDLGAERATDWVIGMLYLLINRRYENMRPTIFTSNMKLEELAVYLDPRIPARIERMCEIIIPPKYD